MTAFGKYADDGTGSAMKQRDHKDATDLIVTKTAPQNGGCFSGAMAFSCKDHGADAGAIAPTLRGMGNSASHANGGGQVAVAFYTTQITSKSNYSNPKAGDPCHPLASGAHPPAIAFQPGNLCRRAGASPTLGASTLGDQAPHVATKMQVRRLTVTECERLQGFPDGWTNVPYRGKPAADGPRYKALGNSMAVNVMNWIGRRIKMANELETPK